MDRMLIEAEPLAGLERIRHGFFTREGGVSRGIYASLNCGFGSQDAAADVAENRRRVAERLGARAEMLATPRQHHSADVAVAEAPWPREAMPRADAVVTTQPGLAIGVSTADCVPVLLAHGTAGVIAAAHAGWRGALAGVLEAAVAAMERLGAARGGIVAAVGPAISQTAYEVGEDFERNFLAEDPESEGFFTRPDKAARPHFDLPGYVAARLERTEIARVDTLKICTYAAEDRLFSYRRSVHRREADYGRQISAIVIQ